jgi:hypothetical protein
MTVLGDDSEGQYAPKSRYTLTDYIPEIMQDRLSEVIWFNLYLDFLASLGMTLDDYNNANRFDEFKKLVKDAISEDHDSEMKQTS